MFFYNNQARILIVYRPNDFKTPSGDYDDWEVFGKTNQDTIDALIAFLVWIVFFHSTSCNAFVLGVQAFQSPKTPSKINNVLCFGGKSNKSSTMRLFLHSSWLLHLLQRNFWKAQQTTVLHLSSFLSHSTALLLSSFLSLATALLLSIFLSQMALVQLQLWVSCTFMSHSEW